MEYLDTPTKIYFFGKFSRRLKQPSAEERRALCQIKRR